MADSEPKDFKAVKVQLKAGQKSGGQETLSRSMLYSGINIFGQLSQLYIQSKESGGGYSAFSEQIGKGKQGGGGEDGGSMLSLNQEVLAIFKRLQKKDSTTKIKAFQELERYVDQMDGGAGLNQSMMSEEYSASQTDEIQNLLTFFLYHFCRILTNEPDRKVREAAHLTLSAFIRKAKRRLGPHLKRIFSLWFCSFFDVSQEVALLARKNFEAAFPEAKRDQVFKIAYKNFLHFANEQLKQSEDQISENVADLSKVQREEVFDRITGSVLLALAQSFEFIKEWNEEERLHYRKKLVDILDLSAPVQIMGAEEESKKPQAKKQQHTSYLWNFLQSKYRGRVRAACLQFITSLLTNIPRELIESQMSQLAPGVHNLVSEDNSQIQNTLWRETLFTLGKNFPASWEQTNIKKNFLPKLYTCLKASAFGSPAALYDNFVKFTSIFPLYHLIDYTEDKTNKASFKERASLIRETLTTLYQGLKNDESVAFHQDLMKCYSETFAFLVLKRVQPLVISEKANQDDKDFAIQQLKKCIQLPLEDFINNYEKFQSKVQNQRNIRSTIPSQIAKFLKDIAERSVDKRIFNSIIDYILESILVAPEKINIVRVFSSIFISGIPKDSPYLIEGLFSGLVFKFLTILNEKVTADIDNLSKENIDSVFSKANQVQKIMYKIAKLSIEANIDQVREVFISVTQNFMKVSKKEELASKVLSHEILSKFKTLKDSFLSTAILCQNIMGKITVGDFKQLIQFVLESKSIDQKLKIKTLLPSQDFEKVNFSTYYEVINEEDIHTLILNFVIQQIIHDEKQIVHNWSLIDQGLVMLKSKQSFLKDSDRLVLAKEIHIKLNLAKQSDFLSAQYYFSAIKSILPVKEINELDSLRELLFEKLIIIKSSHPTFSPLWNIYSATLKAHISSDRTPYFDFSIKRLKKELLSIINQKAHYTQKGVAQFDAINRFTLIVRSFVQLLQNATERQHVIEEILLQEDTFTSNLESNCLPLKMFKDLFLQGGLGGFDVTKLFQDNKFVWLAAVLLNVRHLPSLSNFIEMKKQLIIFVDTEVIPALINQTQSGNTQFIMEIFNYMRDRAHENMDYIHSIDHFIKKMIDPGEDYPSEEKPLLKIDDFKQIFKMAKTETLLTDNEYTHDTLLFLKVLRNTAYFIMDEEEISKLWEVSNEILNSFVSDSKQQITARVTIALEIFQSLSQYLGNEISKSLENNLVLRLLSLSQPSIDSYLLNSILDYIAHQLETLGVSSFTQLIKQKVNFQNFLTWIFDVQRNQSLQPLTYIYMLQIIRKTLHLTELISDQQLIINQVIDIAKEHALTFDIKLTRVQELISQAIKVEQGEAKVTLKKAVHFNQDEEEDKEVQEDEDEVNQIEDFEYQMLQEIAETLLAMTNLVRPSINENDLYILISSGVEALQKAAFVLLKQLYENYIPDLIFKIEDNEMLLQIKQEAQEQEVEEEEHKKEEAKGGDHYHHHDHQNYKNKLAFKNISDILIEIIENPPALNADGTVHQQHVISSSTQVEKLIFQDTHDSSQNQGGINSKTFGYLLAWNAMLMKIENGRIKSQLQGQSDYSQVLGALNEYLEENPGIYRMYLISLLAFLPEEKRGLHDAYNVSNFEPEYIELSDRKQSSQMTIYSLLNFMKSFPSLARKYFQECDKQLLELVMPYIKQIVSPAILENEIKKIEVAQLSLGQNELTFSLFKSTKEILANFKKGEIEMTLKIKIPADYPLKLVEVDVSKQLKISEKQLRKWILAIRKIIQFQNGDIISAVLAWKANIEREIDGVEDCYICYCVVHENDQSLPKMPCKTCKNKFHVACIRKWFRQSHKSNCPICQNYFF